VHRPAPEVSIKISLPDNDGETFTVVAIVDAGASRTCVPLSFMSKLGVGDYNWCEIGGITGSGRVAIFVATIEVLKC
jgi:hypothetical protein